ncbi:MAG: hypothetical protein JSU04_19460 [Bdellovibrionales bacterium]|nr:hypothetical protein [Bdellovibrionales bacterium]
MKFLGFIATALMISSAQAAWNCKDVSAKLQQQNPGSEINLTVSCLPQVSSDPRPLCLTVLKISEDLFQYHTNRYNQEASELVLSPVSSATNKTAHFGLITLRMENHLEGYPEWKSTTVYSPVLSQLYVDYYRFSKHLDAYEHIENQSYSCKILRK